jgi:hypothetical protein
VTTLTGHVAHRRCYYHCDRCGRGFCPGDDELSDNGRYSKAAENVIALAGIHEPFRPARGLLRRLAGMRLPAPTVRRLTEAVGRRLAQEQGQGRTIPNPPQARPWDFRLRDAADQRRAATVGYVGLDAFAVPTRLPDGKVKYRMLYVGILYPPGKEERRYLADFDLQALARQLRANAVTCGYGRAEQVVALTDGGNGLQEALERCFGGKTTCVLDFWHAAQHVFDFAKAWCGGDEAAGRRLGEAGREVLRAQGGQGLLTWLEAHGTGGMDAAQAAALAELRGYVENNVERMAYPEYRARHWDIGSGPVEAECKVLGRRLKGTGQRWGAAEAEAVAKLRAVYKSAEELWDVYFGVPQPAAQT